MLLGCLLAVSIAAEASAQKIYGIDDARYVTSSRDPAVIGYVICLQDAVSATPRGISMEDALAGAVSSCQRWARRLPNTRGEPDAGEILQSIRECGFRPGDASPDAGCGRQANAGGNRGPRSPASGAEQIVLTPTVIPPGQNVEGIAFDGKWLWAAESGQRTIARIDLTRGTAVERVKVGRLPVDMASTGDGDVFALVQTDNAIWRQRAGRGSVFAHVPDCPNGMVAHRGNLWVLNQPTCSSEHSRVSRVDARNGRQVQSSELGEWGQALTALGRQIWVAHARGVALTAVDVDSLRAFPVEVRSASLWAITANPSNVYAGGRIDGTSDDGLVVKIDPATRTEVARARVSQRVTSLVGDDENIVAIGDKGTIWVLSAQNLTLRRTITLSTGAFSPRAMKIVQDNLLVTATTFRGENGAVFVLRNWWPAVAAVPQNSAPNRFAGPSFDCATARSAAEQVICANSQLAALDRALNKGYNIALGNITSPAVGGSVAGVLAFKREQRAWL